MSFNSFAGGNLLDRTRAEKIQKTVEDITRIALSTNSERLRIESLTLLDGVSWPSASVLLHFGHKDPYPILRHFELYRL